jgi:hypothetical protein
VRRLRVGGQPHGSPLVFAIIHRFDLGRFDRERRIGAVARGIGRAGIHSVTERDDCLRVVQRQAVGHELARPELRKQLVLTDHPLAMVDQVHERVERLRFHWDDLVGAFQGARQLIDLTVGRKTELSQLQEAWARPAGLHRPSCSAVSRESARAASPPR